MQSVKNQGNFSLDVLEIWVTDTEQSHHIVYGSKSKCSCYNGFNTNGTLYASTTIKLCYYLITLWKLATNILALICSKNERDCIMEKQILYSWQSWWQTYQLQMLTDTYHLLWGPYSTDTTKTRRCKSAKVFVLAPKTDTCSCGKYAGKQDFHLDQITAVLN